MKLAISDDHQGLKSALAAELPGAAWQRRRTHFMPNLLTRAPRSVQDLVSTLARAIFAQPDAKEVWAQHGRVVEQLEKRFGEAAKLLAKQNDEWAVARRCLSTQALDQAQAGRQEPGEEIEAVKRLAA